MNDQQRLQLNRMIQTNNVEDQTQLIRELKHSEILQHNVNKMLSLKAQSVKESWSDTQLNEQLIRECSFLHTYYTDIFNKVKKDEIDLSLLNMFLNVLRNIEEGRIDQHEGSFQVGTILKEIYLDSAIKKGAKLDASHKQEQEQEQEPWSGIMDISWKDFKKTDVYLQAPEVSLESNKKRKQREREERLKEKEKEHKTTV